MFEVNVLENCTFSCNIKIGTGEFHDSQVWGYLGDEKFVSAGVHPFGTLTDLQNKTDITEFLYFAWGNYFKEIHIKVSSNNNQDGYKKMCKLFEKNLTVTVNDISYLLGSSIVMNGLVGTINEVEDFIGMEKYEYGCLYRRDGAQELAVLLQENVGKTLHFCFEWK